MFKFIHAADIHQDSPLRGLERYEGAPVDGSAWGSAADAGQGVARGGSWHDTPDVCRSAVRLRAIAGEGDDFIGFRVALRAL